MNDSTRENPIERHAQQRDSEKARKQFVVFENTLRIIDKFAEEELKTLFPAANYLADKLPRGVLRITNHEYYVKKNEDEAQSQLFLLHDDGEVSLFGVEKDLKLVHDVSLASTKEYQDFVTDMREEFEKLKKVLPYDSTREALS